MLEDRTFNNTFDQANGLWQWNRYGFARLLDSFIVSFAPTIANVSLVAEWFFALLRRTSFDGLSSDAKRDRCSPGSLRSHARRP